MYLEDNKFKYTLLQMKKNVGVYGLLAPYFVLFTIFTIVPVLLSLPMGFTNFNMAQFPQWVGLSNFYSLFLEDEVFLKAIENTLVFAVVTGPLSYFLCFILAWLINELPGALKTIFTFVFYAPTLAGNIFTTWQLIFSGDTYGIANAYLIDLGITNGAIQWLTDANYIMGVLIVVQLWMALGAGFLAIRAGLQGIPRDRYEAGAIEGIKNRAQELIYVTIPAMGPQLLFAAVMQITSSFTAGDIGRSLTAFPTTDYAGHTIMTHAFDYGSIRFEMGYSSAICFVLFATMLIANWGIKKILNKYLDT
ncbi:MAG: sugar ABC transporter permease [Ruminiclostridium sp.]|nr:sugar ABC transporter permease [Ruminiclostridium sp.]MBR4111454.1 sugar ABC transporter permease [Ruminiclostridium sp.]